MYELHNARYVMDMNGGGDIWRLCGSCLEHPAANELGEIMPSTPVEFNETTNVLKTFSGSLYKIVSFAGNEKSIIKQINKDIVNKGYEVR